MNPFSVASRSGCWWRARDGYPARAGWGIARNALAHGRPRRRMGRDAGTGAWAGHHDLFTLIRRTDRLPGLADCEPGHLRGRATRVLHRSHVRPIQRPTGVSREGPHPNPTATTEAGDSADTTRHNRPEPAFGGGRARLCGICRSGFNPRRRRSSRCRERLSVRAHRGPRSRCPNPRRDP